MDVLAKGTPGFSGADLENLVNEAALLAAKAGKNQLDMDDFEMAKDKVLMGKERRSLIMSDDEKRVTAYHEAGHALVARLLPGCDPIHKVSIIPRGRALGITMQLPAEDRHNHSKTFLENNLVVLLGGRTAELLVLKEMTTGAGNDIERATKTARLMVCQWGMSEAMGPLSLGEKTEEIFLGRELAHHKDYSEDTARQVDAEVKRIIMDAQSKAERLLTENMAFLEVIAKALLDRETITGEDLDCIMRGEELPPVPANGGSNWGRTNGYDAYVQAAKEETAAKKDAVAKDDLAPTSAAKDGGDGDEFHPGAR